MEVNVSKHPELNGKIVYTTAKRVNSTSSLTQRSSEPPLKSSRQLSPDDPVILAKISKYPVLKNYWGEKFFYKIYASFFMAWNKLQMKQAMAILRSK